MEFFTMFKKPPRQQEVFDNNIQKVYKTKIDSKTGRRYQAVEKTIDVYAKIQEYADEVNITSILQRYNLDMFKQLKTDEEQFIDLTNLPTNLMETMSIIDNARSAWDRQSKEIKQKFNNDFNQFIASSETGQLAKILNDELKVGLDKFNVNNMANYNQIYNIHEPAVQPIVQQPQNVQPAVQQTQNIQQNNNLGGQNV